MHVPAFLSSYCHMLKCAKWILSHILNVTLEPAFFSVLQPLVPRRNEVSLAKKTFVTIQWQFSSPLVFSKSWCFLLLCIFLTAKACISIGVQGPHQSSLSWVSLPIAFSCYFPFHAFFPRRLLPTQYSLTFRHTSAKTAVSTPATPMVRPREAPFLAI